MYNEIYYCCTAELDQAFMHDRVVSCLGLACLGWLLSVAHSAAHICQLVSIFPSICYRGRASEPTSQYYTRDIAWHF